MTMRPDRRRSVLLIPALAFAAVLLPAGCASAGHKWGRKSAAAASVEPPARVSMRPIYPMNRVKQLYPSGYAGANYGPGVNRRSIQASRYVVPAPGLVPTPAIP